MQPKIACTSQLLAAFHCTLGNIWYKCRIIHNSNSRKCIDPRCSRKESSLNPPSNLFLRCLAFSDLCVGLVMQPVGVVSLMAAFYHRWNFCHVAELLWYSFSIMAADFSLATLSANSVDAIFPFVNKQCHFRNP